MRKLSSEIRQNLEHYLDSLSADKIKIIASVERDTRISDDLIILAIDRIDDEEYISKIAIESYSSHDRLGFTKTVRKYAFSKVTDPKILENIVFQAADNSIQYKAMMKLSKINPQIYKKVIFRSENTRLKLNALRLIDDLDLLFRFAMEVRNYLMR